MNRTLNFFERNIKELLRDPVIYIFGLGFPVVTLILFMIINRFTSGQTPIFQLKSLLPGIIEFSYSFVTLILALVVSKDRQTFFLKRLYSSPMKSYDFILGYFFVGLFVGLIQTVICIITGLIISSITATDFVSFLNILLLIVSQLPLLITDICLGILLGTLFNDKSAPGVCSVLISVSGILGGCWMPIETMGSFETFCRILPFYPSVYLGRIFTKATNAIGSAYTFDNIAAIGLIPIFSFMTASMILTVVAFKKSMVSDK